jgi:hypothetical protein
MMTTILDIVNRTPEPAPWSEGDNIPWDDPALSERMLAEHLSQGSEQIRRSGEQGPSWYTAESGLFSNRPHLVLQENFWDENAKASTVRFVIIDAQTGAVSSYALSNEAYTEDEFGDVLRTAGFGDVRKYPSLAGKAGAEEMPVFLTRC